jgi:hypothetical protein
MSLRNLVILLILSIKLTRLLEDEQSVSGLHDACA